MKILILSYIERKYDFWLNNTAKFVNNLAEIEKAFITLFVVYPKNLLFDPIDVIDKKVEIRPVILDETNAKTDLPIVELFFNPNIQNYIFDHLEEILVEKTFDVIQFDSILFANFFTNIKGLSNTYLVYRQYFSESKFVQNKSKTFTISLFKHINLSRLGNRLKNLETVYLPKFDYLIVNQESNLVNLFEKTFILPSEIPNNVSITPVKDFKLFAIANLENTKIQRAYLWFLNEIWHSLIEQLPEIELHIAGRSEPWFTTLLSKYPKVYYYSKVDDVYKFMKDKMVLLLPYDFPYGLTYEYLLAMKMGKIIIANPEAVSSWGLSVMIHYLPARTSAKFLEIIKHLHSKPELQSYFSDQIFNFASKHINEKFIAETLFNFYYRTFAKPNSNGSDRI